jgi:hypothetical protein
MYLRNPTDLSLVCQTTNGVKIGHLQYGEQPFKWMRYNLASHNGQVNYPIYNAMIVPV